MTTAPRRTCTAELACDGFAPATARRLVTLLLRQWDVRSESVIGDANLVVSELVTNAVVHCEGDAPVTVRVELHDDRVRVEVADRHPSLPTQRQAEDGAEGGRGLGIVARLAASWGVEPSSAGKRIYADVPLSSAVA
jgi:anti-sigma regulatory factor (Ser/Thr protein kinase)